MRRFAEHTQPNWWTNLAALCCVLCIAACGNSYQIEEEKMVQIAAEKRLAFTHIDKAQLPARQEDSVKSSCLDEILQRHEETWARYDSTMKLYYLDVDSYKSFLKKLDNHLKDLEKELTLSDTTLLKQK